MPGRRAATASRPSPRRARLSARYDCENTSAPSIRFHIASTPSVVSRSTNARRLPWPVSACADCISGHVRRADMQDIGAETGERARDRRPGQHPRRVEHAQTRERLCAFRQRRGGAVADPLDPHRRRLRKQPPLRVGGPLLRVAQNHAGQLRLDQRCLELGGVALRDVLGEARHVVAADRLERPLDDVREAAEQVEMPAVAGREDALTGRHLVGQRLAREHAVDPQHPHAGDRDERVADIDLRRLPRPAGRGCDVADRAGDVREQRRRPLAQPQRRGVSRVVGPVNSIGEVVAGTPAASEIASRSARCMRGPIVSRIVT